MLFILLSVLIVEIFILVVKLFNIEAKYVGDTSSFKLLLKDKEEEIENLKKKIREIKNLNVDVEI